MNPGDFNGIPQEQFSWETGVIYIDQIPYYNLLEFTPPEESSETKSLYGQGAKPTGYSRGGEEPSNEGSMKIRMADWNEIELIAAGAGLNIKKYNLEIYRRLATAEGKTHELHWVVSPSKITEEGYSRGNQDGIVMNVTLRGIVLPQKTINGTPIPQT